MSSGSNKPKKWQRPTLVGNVKKIMALPCDTPPSLYVETAVPALLGVAWDIISPDPKELYHKAFGNSLYHDYKQTLREAEVVPPEETSPATRFFFNALDWADLTVWYLFLFNAFGDGLMDWTTQILRMSQCPNKGYPGQGHGTFWFGAIPDDGRWATMDFQYPEGCRFAPVSGSSLLLGPRQTGIIAASSGFSLFDGTPVTCAGRIANLTTGEVYDSYTPDGPSIANKARTHTFHKHTNHTDHTVVLAQQWSFSGGDVPEHEVFPDNATCFMGIYGEE